MPTIIVLLVIEIDVDEQEFLASSRLGLYELTPRRRGSPIQSVGVNSFGQMPPWGDEM